MSEPHDRSHVDPEYLFPEPRVMPRDMLREAAQFAYEQLRHHWSDADDFETIIEQDYGEGPRAIGHTYIGQAASRLHAALAAVPSESDAGLDALRALSEKATPGEWAVDGAPIDGGLVWAPDPSGKRDREIVVDGFRDADARFLAAAVNYVRARLARP